MVTIFITGFIKYVEVDGYEHRELQDPVFE